MNETIGVKGGHNDLRKTLKNKEKKKKKIEEEEETKALKELENKVKKQQRYTLIRTLPIILIGGTIKTFYEVSNDKKQENVERENKKSTKAVEDTSSDVKYLDEPTIEDKIKEFDIVNSDGKKVTVKVSRPDWKMILDGVKELSAPEMTIEKEENKEENKEDKKKKEQEKDNDIVITEKQEVIPIRETKIGVSDYDINSDYETSEIDTESLPDYVREKLLKLKSRKIIDEYEKQLKDIRYDLRKLIFDYNVLVDESDEVVLSEEVEVILSKLSEVISKVEELKRKIRIEDLDKYDDNYIYTLIEGYLEEFKDNKIVSEIKDSALYILISKKLEELDNKKDDLNKKVEEKKENLEEKEKNFEKLKEKFFNLDKINKELVKFQDEEKALLREVQEKVKNAISVQEKVEVEVEAMSRQSRKLLRMLSLSMFFPGVRSAKSMAFSTATYLYFMNNILKPKTVTKKYKVITVKDYSKDIEKSIKSIDNAYELLGKTSKQVNKMISLINEEFKDYIGVIPECDELLSNLRKINNELKEKEYEMEKMKKEQELILEKNNGKVKTRGTYQM